MKKYRNDFILIIAFLLVALIGMLALYLIPASSDAVAVVEVDGKEVAALELGDDTEYLVDTEYGTNVIKITDQRVCVFDANCPDKLCVKQGYISKNGQSIICLPHRLVVTVRNGGDSEVDAVAGGGQR